jgi:hypothetical protein
LCFIVKGQENKPNVVVILTDDARLHILVLKQTQLALKYLAKLGLSSDVITIALGK